MAVTLGDAGDGALLDPERIIMKLRDNWGLTSAQQISRALVDSDGDNLHLPQHVDAVLEHCEVCRTFDRAPPAPIAGTSTFSMPRRKLQVDLLS